MFQNKLLVLGSGLVLAGAFSAAFARRGIWSRIAMAQPTSGAAAVAGGIKELAPSKDVFASLGKFRVIDVREPSERVEIGFVPTSANVPLDKVLDGSANIPTDKPLLMVCKSGRRSMRAAETLQARGYRDLTNLTGGTLGWIEAGLPVEHVTPAPIKEVFPSKDLMAKLSTYTVVDVREPSERVETGYVPGSLNLPLATILEGSAKVPDEKKPYLLVCRSGKRSMKASEALSSRGLDCTNLASGTMGWIESGLPVQRD